jgi:alpha-N-acetylglucosaminidase
MEEEQKNEEMLRDTVKTIDVDSKESKSTCLTQKTIIIIISICILIIVAAVVTAIVLLVLNDDNDEDDVLTGLLDRQFPEIKDRFEFKVEQSNENETFFEISTSGTDPLETKITIKGNNKLSISSGLGYYLRYHALSQISWTGDSLKNLKNKKLSPLNEPIRKTSKLKYSYYMNTCTHSYSAAWWDWPRWEREIDWMALNGINLPLAFTGLEYVTRKVFKEMGFTDEELKNWITGPAFMAWYRMGNINGWAGPTPDEWIDYQHDLQLKILERMRDYGMTPVLSMFSGYVPDTFTKHYPDANVTMGSDWASFDIKYRTYTLEVTDPRFNEIAKRFIEIQTETYGTSHIYNGDVYNEMLPRTNDTEYLRRSSQGTFEGIRAADPEAIWLMQGWLFVNEAYFWQEEQVKAYLSGVPNDGMIILDLFTEYTPVWSKFQNYFGKQWIWCTLHNFGGNPGMWGNLTHLLQRPQEDIYNSNGTMIGIGITMEAIEQNYVVYEAVLENKWLDGKVENISKWVEDYSSRRYGDDSISQVKQAWEIMLQNIYFSPYHNTSQIEKVPSFTNNIKIDPEKLSVYGRYKNTVGAGLIGTIEDLWKAWGLLLDDEVINKLKDLDTYNHDIVDLGVNVLTNEFDIERKVFTTAYNNKNLEELQTSGQKLLTFIEDADKLLASDKIYLLGRWINRAIKIAPDTQYQKLFEFNARNQITLWGPDGNINDYAAKSWAGLYIDYYYQRWKLFVDRVIDAVKSEVEFDYDEFKEAAMNFSKSWQNSNTTYSSDPIGISSTIAKELYNKYK